MDYIKVRGARQHNLKNINLDIPKNKLVVFTGLSGSGKSSLAFDTVYAEGQRRYVESLSAYARQFLGIMDKPDVDTIEGLSPSISIDQKSASHNPRSTVGTVTEIYDYLRLLFARIGHPHCSKCGREISRQSLDQIISRIFNLINEQFKITAGNKPLRYMIFSPIVKDRKGEFAELFSNLKSKGIERCRIDNHVFSLNEDFLLIKTNKHSIDAEFDKFSISKKEWRSDIYRSNLKTRLTDSVEQSLKLSEGQVILSEISDTGFEIPIKPKNFKDHLFSEKFACPVCNINFSEIEPRMFSFNSPHGACPLCSGIGSLLKIDRDLILNKKLSINEGGILPYARFLEHDTWFSRLFYQVVSDHRIDPKTAIFNLSQEKMDILINGTGSRIYRVTGKNRFGVQTEIYQSFKGVVADLEEKYSQTESEWVRSEIEKYLRKEICPSCLGNRLKKEVLGITVNHKSIADVTDLSITECLDFINNLSEQLSEREKIIAASIIKEIKFRLNFMYAVGLEYLTLGRSAVTLSGGEAQRIRLASQIGSGLSGVLYVLDEPSIGLHSKDTGKLIKTLQNLRDLGNTVIVVEHDRQIMENSDWMFDFGPQAGEKGGEIVFSGRLKDLITKGRTLTSKYLKNLRLTLIKKPESPQHFGMIKLQGATANNLKNIDICFPLGKFICVTGVSGSGKSTLIVETLYHALMLKFNPYHKEKPGKYTEITGINLIDKVILVDQSPIGRTPRSNPATYTGLFTHIRDLFASLPSAKEHGFSLGRFSFNVKGGRCETCQGEGQIKIEMQFLSDIFVTCEVCKGKRYNQETLEIKYKGKNISDVLDMTVEEADRFFVNIPQIKAKLETLKKVGLTYIHLGQSAPTLSGGEAQRVKLATELSKKQTGRTFYILDEPTTGLHFADLEKLLRVLLELTYRGNTVVVIEHNLDIVKNADYIIDLGIDGGEKGGAVVVAGTPEKVANCADSYTGMYLKKLIK